MATVHFIQQGKGGVGKSMIASILYQTLRLLGKQVIAFDTDPVNATLAGFKEFEVSCLDIGHVPPAKPGACGVSRSKRLNIWAA